jgi:hypothetical protein
VNQDEWLRAQGSRFIIKGAGLRAQGIGFTTKGAGFRVKGLGVDNSRLHSSSFTLRVSAPNYTHPVNHPPGKRAKELVLSKNLILSVQFHQIRA